MAVKTELNKDGLVGGALVSERDFLKVMAKKRQDKKLVAKQQVESKAAAAKSKA